MTGEEDLDLLVQRFIETEDKNFALFNFVNEQNNEIETLHEQIEEVGFFSHFLTLLFFIIFHTNLNCLHLCSHLLT